MKKNRAVATIMKKIVLADYLYLFKYEYLVTGEINEEEGIFIDCNDNEYYSIQNTDLLTSDIDKGFTDVVYIDKLKDVFNENKLTTNELIKKYESTMKRRMYLTYVDENECVIAYPLDVDMIYDEMENLLSIAKGEQNDDMSDLDDQLCEVIKNIIGCKFTNEELDELLEEYSDYKDKLESLIESIILQKEAYDRGDKKPIDNPVLSTEGLTKEDLDYYEEEFVEAEEEIIDQFSDDTNIDLNKLRENIKKYLVNQDEALRRVTAEIARMELKGNENNKGILLFGDTGTGKTYMMDLLAKELNVPFLKIDSTQLTIPGYVGKDIEECLWDLYEKCGKNKAKAEKAIVFFDEIDKKGSNKKSDVSGQGVLNILLKFLDGTEYDATRDTKYSSESVKIKTDKMKVIAGGAFTDVLKKHEEKRSIGFNSDDNIKSKEEIKLDSSTFVKNAGMTEEFMGRFPIRIALNNHDEKSFEEILLNAEGSTLKEEQKAFDKLGVELVASPEFVKKVSTNALKLKSGVRGLMGCVEEATWEAFDDVYSNPGVYERIILTEDTLDDSTNYQKVYKKTIEK